MIFSKRRENLAVELDAALLQLIDERAVGLVAIEAKRCIEADNPELAIISLLVAAVVERILASMLKRLMCKTLFLRAGMTEALYACEHVPAALC